MISSTSQIHNSRHIFQKNVFQRNFRWQILSPEDSLEKGIEVVHQQKDFFRVPFLYFNENLIKSMEQIINELGKDLNRPTTLKQKIKILKRLSPPYQIITPSDSLDTVIEKVNYEIADFWYKLVKNVKSLKKSQGNIE